MKRVTRQISESIAFPMSLSECDALLHDVLQVFAPQFAKDAQVLYAGDSSQQAAAGSRERLASVGFDPRSLAKLPDVVLHVEAQSRLFLVDVCAPLGLIDAARRAELRLAFGATEADLVFVTAFPTRLHMVSCATDIAWESVVWCADNPTHLIHFNGDRFLGPH
jgi:adenine-specific DNA-methyltransferase